MGGSIIEEIYTGIPAWRRYAKRVYYTPYDTVEEQSVVLCPDHRLEFYQYQPSAQERGIELPLTACQICRREVRFEMIVQKQSIGE